MTTDPPPHSIDAERCVLSAIMLDRRAADTAREVLEAADFYVTAHALTWTTLLALADAGQPTDIVVLAEAMRAAGTLEEVGGATWLSGLAAEVAHAKAVEEHAEIVKECSRRRSLLTMGTRLAAAAMRPSEAGSRAMAEELVGALSDMLLGATRGGLVSAGDATHDAIQRVQEAAGRGDGVTGVPTSLPTLTAKTGGLQPGNLIVLGARPSVGKTAAAMAWTISAAEAGCPVAVFSLEMSCTEVAFRLLSLVGNIDLVRMRTGAIDGDEWTRMGDAGDHVAKLPIRIDDRPGATVSQIRTQCRRMRATDGLGLVIVDYLQLVSAEGGNSSTNREQEVARMSRQLKMLAGELAVPVVVLSQLNRAGESRTDKTPRLSDLRETGAIEQDADVVVFLHRPSDYAIKTVMVGNEETPSEGLVQCLLAKQRNGPTLSWWLDWHKERAAFSERVVHLAEVDAAANNVMGASDDEF